jgi:WD40 repeat protein
MDNSLIYWNSQGELKFRNDSFGGWVSSIINIKKGKENFMAVGSWDSKVRIFNNQYAIDRTIEGNGYAVTSMSTDDEGDYLFVAYKDGTVKVWNLKGNKNTEDICRRTIETNVNVNTINFQSKYFQVFAIGTNKGLQLRQIKTNKIYDTKIYIPCNSIAYDSTKTYLFAGYSDGVIRVFKFGMSE